MTIAPRDDLTAAKLSFLRLGGAESAYVYLATAVRCYAVNLIPWTRCGGSRARNPQQLREGVLSMTAPQRAIVASTQTLCRVFKGELTFDQYSGTNIITGQFKGLAFSISVVIP